MDKTVTVFTKVAKEKKKRYALLGATAVAVGVGQVGEAHRSGALTGRETIYHSTGSKNVAKIKEEGLRHKFSTDPHNITNLVLKDVPLDKKRGKVYMARNKGWHVDFLFKQLKALAENPAAAAFMDPFKRVSLRIPLTDIAKHEVANPELRGVTSKAQFFQRAHRNAMRNIPAYREKTESLPRWRQKIRAWNIKQGYKGLTSGATLVYEGNVSPEHVVSSKHYKSTKFKDILSHMKKRPAMFTKGVVRAVAGTALMAAPVVVSKMRKKK